MPGPPNPFQEFSDDLSRHHLAAALFSKIEGDGQSARVGFTDNPGQFLHTPRRTLGLESETQINIGEEAHHAVGKMQDMIDLRTVLPDGQPATGAFAHHRIDADPQQALESLLGLFRRDTRCIVEVKIGFDARLIKGNSGSLSLICRKSRRSLNALPRSLQKYSTLLRDADPERISIAERQFG